MTDLRVLYRGPLSSCNYDCAYCPFAKHVSDREELRRDQASLERFVDAVERNTDQTFQILFTPWGEALTHRWYWRAITRLTAMTHVRKVAAQTNLSWRPELAKRAVESDAARARFGLWTTFHPTETTVDRFIEKVRALDGFSVSVGIVGLRENMGYAEELKARLPSHAHLWVNAYKSDGPGYYRDDEAERYAMLDREFALNNVRHPSRGKPCRAGTHAISVNGLGETRRCHFVDQVVGNFFTDPLASLLNTEPAPCPNETCGCYIGYVHLEELAQYELYGDRLMERVPRTSRSLRVLETA